MHTGVDQVFPKFAPRQPAACKPVHDRDIGLKSQGYNVGTHPLYACTSDPTMSVSVIFKDFSANGDAQSCAMCPVPSQVHTAAMFFSENSAVLFKPGYLPHLNITAPFSLGILSKDVINDHCYSIVTLFFSRLTMVCHSVVSYQLYD